MLLHHGPGARHGPAPDGRLVPLAEQDRGPVEYPPDRRRVSMCSRQPSPVTAWASFQAQARHRRAPRPTPGRSRRPTGCRSSSGTTNWCASPKGPVARLNRARRGSAEADGPRAGLAALAELDPALPPPRWPPRPYLHERERRPRSRPARLYAESRPGGAPTSPETRAPHANKPHGSTRSCAVERRAAGIHRPR